MDWDCVVSQDWTVIPGRGGWMVETSDGKRIVRGAGGCPDRASAHLVAMVPQLVGALGRAIWLLDKTIGTGWRAEWAFNEIFDEAMRLWAEHIRQTQG